MKTDVREQWLLRQGTATSLLKPEQLVLSTAPGKSLGLNAETDS